jgi:hypothetical protein
VVSYTENGEDRAAVLPQEEKPSALVADGLLFLVSQEDKAVRD